MNKRYRVIESGPIAGIAPTDTEYDDFPSAWNYAATRVNFFARVDLCKVLARSSTTLAPQVSVDDTGDR